MKITRKQWCENRNDVFLFEIDDEAGMRACVSNYGGVLQALYVRNKDGVELDTVLGYDDFEAYHNSETFFGAMVGPVADRLAQGSCILDGVTVQLPLNAGPDCMHSGPAGFHSRVWKWEILSDGVSLYDVLEDTGFPGRLEVRMNYRLCGGNVLRIEYSASCDRETTISFTNHSYFTLNGASTDCRNQILRVNASRYAETRRDVDPICTGRTPDVKGTPFDMRSGCRIGDVLQCADFREIQTGGGIDHYFLVDGSGMREHLRLECPESGMALSCCSDAPGVLIYTANGLEAEAGKGSAVYGKNWAVCMETECFPNAVNLPDWRSSVLLQPGESWHSATEFSFRNLLLCDC